MVRTRIQKSNVEATTSSMCPISILRSRGQPVAPAQVTAPSKSGPFGRRHKGTRSKQVQLSEGDVQARSIADAVARRSYGKLVAFLSTHTRDVASVEDALSEAFAAALNDWPVNGCPTNPEAWLLTVARRKLIDASRRRR